MFRKLTKKTKIKPARINNMLEKGFARPVVVTDVHGYKWDFSGRYIVTRLGQVVSLLKPNNPRLIGQVMTDSSTGKRYPFVSLRVENEKLTISTAQVVKQVFANDLRLRGYQGMIRKNANSMDVSIANLQQAKHWNDVRQVSDIEALPGPQGTRERREAFDAEIARVFD